VGHVSRRCSAQSLGLLSFPQAIPFLHLQVAVRGASYPQCCDAGGRDVEADVALGLVNRLLWTALVISAPVLGAALAVGLAISVLQVATQLQEMTLTYVPKMLVVVLALIALGPWMLHQLTQFATAMMRLCGVTEFSRRVAG